MENIPINFFLTNLIFFKYFTNNIRYLFYRKLKNSTSIHLHLICFFRILSYSIRQSAFIMPAPTGQSLTFGPFRMRSRSIKGSLSCLYHRSSCSITKQNTSSTVCPVRKIRHTFTSNDQHRLINTALKVCLCCIIRKHKSCTGSAEIKTSCSERTQIFLYFTSCTRKDYLRRNRRY